MEKLFSWAREAERPLCTYATGLLARAMENQEIAANYREENSALVGHTACTQTSPPPPSPPYTHTHTHTHTPDSTPYFKEHFARFILNPIFNFYLWAFNS